MSGNRLFEHGNVSINEEMYHNIVKVVSIKCGGCAFNEAFEKWSPNLITYIAQTSITELLKILAAQAKDASPCSQDS